MESNEKSKINGYIFILLNSINQKDSKKISDKIINLNKTYVYINVQNLKIAHFVELIINKKRLL